MFKLLNKARDKGTLLELKLKQQSEAGPQVEKLIAEVTEQIHLLEPELNSLKKEAEKNSGQTAKTSRDEKKDIPTHGKGELKIELKNIKDEIEAEIKKNKKEFLDCNSQLSQLKEQYKDLEKVIIICNHPLEELRKLSKNFRLCSNNQTESKQRIEISLASSHGQEKRRSHR